MKKIYFIALFALVCNFAIAQVQPTSYRGAFAPTGSMWTTGWTNFDPQNAVYAASNVTISSDITSNTRWTKNNVYRLSGLITVRNNATLTIEAGTVIRSSQEASALVITRGAKLIANGTASEPIVFTSNNAIGSRQRGDWGGIVMLGRSRYNINGGVNFIEGLTQTSITEFGGGTNPDANDNSGVLRFVRIEYAGYTLTPNNELNGLTMGAIGRGTVIENVQVSYSNDDSFEWFGGTVNCRNLVAFAGLDDDFDVDNGYTGVVQFGLAVKDPLAADQSTSEIFEVDNNATPADTDTSANPWADFTSGIFTNFTAVGANARPNGASTVVAPNSLHDRALRLRRNSRLNIYNSIFVDSRRGLHIESLSSNAAYVNDFARFKNNTIAGQSLANALAFTNTTGSTTPTTAAATAWFNSAANANTLNTSSVGILVNPYNGTNATDYRLVGEGSGTIDYRPSSTTGADFTDSKLTPFIVLGDAPGVTATLQYCRGDVAPALTANLTATGVSLRWFTTAAVPLTPIRTDDPATIVDVNVAPYINAPVPATSAVGTRIYYVREMNAAGTLSAAATITVTTVASPAVALGSISSTVGGVAATAAVGIYVGTTTELTYTVPASTESTVTGYRWTVPAGVNIIGASNTNTIVVNYANVPAGIFKVGNISVQAINAEGCGGAIKTLAITAALPAAPGALVLNDGSTRTNTLTGVTSNVAVTSFARFMGTTTPLTLVATPVVGAQGYVWELPAGVNITTQTTVASDVTRFYNLFPFVGAGSSINPGFNTVTTNGVTTNTAVVATNGNVFYEIRTITYTDGTRVVTGRIRQNSRAATTGVGGLPSIASRNEELTNRTNQGVLINPAYPLVASVSNVLNVNVAGVTSANTFNFLTTATVPVSTNRMRIGVKAFHGVGASVTANTTATSPATSSTAKLLTLSAVRPVAPAAIKMTNDAVSTTTAVTNISRFVGTTTPFTLTATPSLLASSYSWELPDGVNLLLGALTGLNSNTITVNFAGVSAGTTAVNIGIRAVNGIGSSVTVNAAPNEANTAKLLRLTAAVPAAAAAVTGPIAALCPSVPYTYTITPSLLATSYTIFAPTGAVVNAVSNNVTYVANLSGANEVPSNSSAATGTATLVFNTVTKIFTVTVNHTLATPAAGHIHKGAAGTNGTVVYPFASLASPITYTSGVLTAEQEADLNAGLLYVNLHSADYQAGEIRGNLFQQVNTSNTLTTSDLMFTVVYPAGFVATTTAPKSLVIAAVNGVGTSLTNRTLALSTLVPAVGVVTSSTGGITTFNQGLTAKVFTVATSPLFTGYTWTASNGAVITAGQGTSSITVDFSGVVGTTTATRSIIAVAGTTPCGASAVRALTLSWNGSALRSRQDADVNATEVYPNPVSSNFNIDVTAAKAGVLEIAVYSLDGTLVVSPKSVELKEGVNTITENVSALNSGIYILKLINSSNGEVITKKLIKE